MRDGRVRKVPSWKRKRGVSDVVLRWDRYFRSAETGQVDERVAPSVTVQLVRKGSVFEAFISSWTMDVEMVTSERHSVRVVSKEREDGAQNSLARKKLVVDSDRGVVKSLFELPQKTNGDWESRSRGVSLRAFDALDGILEEGVCSRVAEAILDM